MIDRKSEQYYQREYAWQRGWGGGWRRRIDRGIWNVEDFQFYDEDVNDNNHDRVIEEEEKKRKEQY